MTKVGNPNWHEGMETPNPLGRGASSKTEEPGSRIISRLNREKIAMLEKEKELLALAMTKLEENIKENDVPSIKLYIDKHIPNAKPQTREEKLLKQQELIERIGKSYQDGTYTAEQKDDMIAKVLSEEY